MGFVVPALAALGNGSALAGGLALAGAAAAGYSAYSQVKAGQEANAQAKDAARREADSARQSEIERRRALQQVLATRVAGAGAAGVGTGGSIGALTRTDIRDNRNDLLVDASNSAGRQRALRSQGRSSLLSGYAGAAGTLASGAKDFYNATGGKKPPPPPKA